MNSEMIAPEFLAAQSLKVAILRLEGLNVHLHAEDFDFDQSSLVIILGRLNTAESREAFVDLFEFSMGDVIFNAIGYITNEYREDLVPVMQERIGRPLCLQVLSPEPYARVLSQQGRDKLLKNWLSDMGYA